MRIFLYLYIYIYIYYIFIYMYATAAGDTTKAYFYDFLFPLFLFQVELRWLLVLSFRPDRPARLDRPDRLDRPNWLDRPACWIGRIGQIGRISWIGWMIALAMNEKARKGGGSQKKKSGCPPTRNPGNLSPREPCPQAFLRTSLQRSLSHKES